MLIITCPQCGTSIDYAGPVNPAEDECCRAAIAEREAVAEYCLAKPLDARRHEADSLECELAGHSSVQR